MKKVVSILDVANKVGVSIKTVSRVINKEKNVKDITKNKVLNAISELNYMPNIAAKSMRSGKSRIVLIVSYGVTSTPYGYPMLNAIDEYLTQNSYNMLIYNVLTDFTVMDNNLETFYNAYKPEYVIFTSFYHREFSLDKNTFPCKTILANCFNKKGDLLSYVPDEELAGENVVRKLINKNYRNIGFLNISINIPAGSLRKKGIEKAIKKHNNKHVKDPITLVTLFVEKNIKELSEVISSEVSNYKPERHIKEQIKLMVGLKNKRDAIICATDSIAMMTYFEIQKQGFSVPDDFGVISFDNFILISRFLDPDLYTMELPHIKMGELASKSILSNNDNIGKVKVPMSLIKGNSLRK